MYAAIPVGMVFFIIRYIQNIYDVIRDFNKEDKKEVIE
jgi:TRAP-type C4-dicarboxylate transport system permease small subunit